MFSLRQILVVACFALYAAGTQLHATNVEQGAAQGFSKAQVEALALFVAEESIRRLRIPLVLRILDWGHDTPTRKEQISALRADPPRMDERGYVFPFGPANGMSFYYDKEQKILYLQERIMRMRGKMPNWGLTVAELVQALTANSNSKQRAGAEFKYDATLDQLVLQKTFSQVPESAEDFYRQVNKMKRNGLVWFKGRFLKMTEAIVKQRQPPASATANAEQFEASLILRHFAVQADDTAWPLQRFKAAWNRPVGRTAPFLLSNTQLHSGQRMYAFILFRGATTDLHGVAQVGASFKLIDPHGSVRLAGQNPLLWNHAPPPTGHLQLGINQIDFTVSDEPYGDYQVQAEVCDVAGARCVNLVHTFTLSAAATEF